MMGKNFATIRHTKVKSQSQHNALNAHNSRAISGSNIVVAKTYKNIILSPTKYKNFDVFVAAKRKAIREGNSKRIDGEKKARFPREVMNKKTNDKELPALSQEFIFSHSHNALPEDQSIEYLKRADQFIKKWFLNCEILSSVIHLDEKTPHIHIHVSYFDEKNNRFIQKTLSQQDKTNIDAIRKAFQEEVADEFDLIKQDGSVVSKEDHQAKASLEIDALKKELSENKKSLTQKEILNLKLKTAQGTLTVSEILEKQRTSINTLLAQKDALNKKIVSSPSSDTHKELETLRNDFQALKHENSELKNDISKLKDTIKHYRKRFGKFISKIRAKFAVKDANKPKIEPIVLPTSKSLGNSGIKMR